MYNHVPMLGSFYSADSLVGHYPTLQSESNPSGFPRTVTRYDKVRFYYITKNGCGCWNRTNHDDLMRVVNGPPFIPAMGPR